MAKVHIVGAGPAGSIAAMSALRNGFDVVVSEEHPTAGLPENCSGLFSKDGLESLHSFVDYRKFVINRMLGADIHFIDEKFSVSQEEPVSFVCDRSALDAELAANAEHEGASINYNERVNGRFHSNNIIGADGPFSSVASHFGFQRISLYAMTLQAKAAYVSEDPHKVKLFFSNSLFPGFFGWVIPHDEYTAELGAGVAAPHSVSLAWKKLLKVTGIEKTGPVKGHPIPLRVRPRTAVKKGNMKVLLAGDAAGQVKATTGGGVIFGGNCAALAGRYAAEPLKYEFAWRMKYGTDLMAHRYIHSYMSSLSDRAMASLGKSLKKLDCDVYLSNHGHMDKPTRMLRPEMVSHFLMNVAGVAFNAR